MGTPHFQIEGHVYFITSVVYNRLPLFTRSTYIIPIIDSLNFYRYRLSFKLLGFVIMPDHVHLLIWPEEARSISAFMRDFKGFTVRRIILQAGVEGSPWAAAFRQAGQATGRSSSKVWQDHYWDQNVYSSTFLHHKLHYIHRNPVRAGLVDAPTDYPYSSFRNYWSATRVMNRRMPRFYAVQAFSGTSCLVKTPVVDHYMLDDESLIEIDREWS